MKDTVMLFINDYKLFVGDFYQGKIKQVKFKTQDYEEIFDTHDFQDFIEYMNYPLGYKKFKGSNLRIYFNQPLTYRYIYESKDRLGESESFGIGNLQQIILQTVEAKYEQSFPLIVECLEKHYEVLEEDGRRVIKVLEEEEVEPQQRISVEELCEQVVGQTSDSNHIEDVLNHWVVFSPATLQVEAEVKQKRQYLEVESELLRVVEDGAQIQSGQELLAYTQSVYKLFGRKQTKTLSSMAPQSGCYVDMRPTADQTWAVKDTILGVVAPCGETKEQTLSWFNEYFKIDTKN